MRAGSEHLSFAVENGNRRTERERRSDRSENATTHRLTGRGPTDRHAAAGRASRSRTGKERAPAKTLPIVSTGPPRGQRWPLRAFTLAAQERPGEPRRLPPGPRVPGRASTLRYTCANREFTVGIRCEGNADRFPII